MTPLIERLIKQHHYPLLDADNYDFFVYRADCGFLFFPGDPLQFPESHDVAVVLPELEEAFSATLQIAVIDHSIERELQQRFRFTRFPSLVLLKKGEYLGALSGILDWNDYMTQIRQLLAAEPSKPPAFDIEQLCSARH